MHSLPLLCTLVFFFLPFVVLLHKQKDREKEIAFILLLLSICTACFFLFAQTNSSFCGFVAQTHREREIELSMQ
jgi:putative effector of murein hydrolase LrgA (UPF0299 family)